MANNSNSTFGTIDTTRSLTSLLLIIAVLLLSSISVLGFSGRLPVSSFSRSAKDTPHGFFAQRRQDTKHDFSSPSSSTNSQQKHHQHHERTVVIAYHKPANTITSHADENAIAANKKGPRQTVYDDIYSMQGWQPSTTTNTKNENNMAHEISFQQATGIQSKLHAIGRLDCDTTGLLLLTNDGGLVHHVTNPTNKLEGTSISMTDAAKSSKITKTYEAAIMGHHENECASFEKMRTEGVDIGAKYGGMTKPVDHLQVLDHPTPKSTLVSLTISEGKNRQVRRMFHSMGSGVMKLRRVKIGSLLTLEGLEEAGQWRIMPDAEVELTLGWSVRDLEKSYSSKRGGGETNKNGHNRQPRKSHQGDEERNRGPGRSASTKYPKSGRRRRI